FPIEMIAPRALRPGTMVTLNAEGGWLVCSDICIPERATLSLSVPVAARGSDNPEWAPRIAQAIAALPQRLNASAHITRGDPAVLSIALPNAPAIRNPYFFPYSQDALRHAAPEQPRLGRQGVSFRLAPGGDRTLGTSVLTGVVAYGMADGRRAAVEV